MLAHQAKDALHLMGCEPSFDSGAVAWSVEVHRDHGSKSQCVKNTVWIVVEVLLHVRG